MVPGPRCLVGCLLPLAPHQLVDRCILRRRMREDGAVSVAPPRRRPWSVGLRARITLGFSLLGLAVSVGLALSSYYFAQKNLLQKFEDNSITVAKTKARTVRDALKPAPVKAESLFGNVMTPEKDGVVGVLLDDGWHAANLNFFTESLPVEFDTAAHNGISGRQRARIGKTDYLLVAITPPVDDATPKTMSSYVQAFSLNDQTSTLKTLAGALILGSTIAAVGAAGIGLWTSRRVLRPLARVAEAANRLASGGLDTRLRNESDPELQRLASSFNNMADAVEERIQREARFASDVSHELRTPLQTLIGSIEILDARKADLPERSRQALDLLVTQSKRFHQMVLDLLEISRLDAGAADLHTEQVMLDQFVSRVANRYGYSHVPVVLEATWEQQPVIVDRRRLERALANLLGNAEHHAGGPVQITLANALVGSSYRVVRIGIEDAGPGVAEPERERIFERFARGATARHRAGTGLGLALVHEHIHLQGGRVWVEDRRNAPGARFVIELPAELPAEEE
jgi:two-component system, OmpR family, sensor histidine kinase MtrB